MFNQVVVTMLCIGAPLFFSDRIPMSAVFSNVHVLSLLWATQTYTTKLCEKLYQNGKNKLFKKKPFAWLTVVVARNATTTKLAVIGKNRVNK